MPTEITQNIAAASSAIASSQIAATQPRTAELSRSTQSPVSQQLNAAAETSAISVHTSSNRTIKRDQTRSEGSFSGSERPDDQKEDQDTDGARDLRRNTEGSKGRLNRVA